MVEGTLKVSSAAVADLRTYHRNPRRGNVAAISESLEVNGQFRPIVVNAGTLTGRPSEVLAGNHTLLAAVELGWTVIQVVTVDVDDEQAARIVAADNRTADLAAYDDADLLALLREMGDTSGSGYQPVDVDNLAALLEEQQGYLPAGRDEIPAGAPPEQGAEVDGTTTNRTHSERLEEYRDRDVRSVYLTFTVDEFAWVVPRLEKLAAKLNVDSNTETVLELIAAATGDPRPVTEAAVLSA